MKIAMPSQRPAAALRQRLFGESRWIPWSFVGLFGVVLLANGIMVSVALDSWTGLVEHNYYRRGLEYNKALAAADAQERLGWQVTIAGRSDAPGALALELDLADATGLAISADRVTAVLERPTVAALDRQFVLESLQRGRYGATLEGLQPGIWDLRLVVNKGADSYETVKRLVVK